MPFRPIQIREPPKGIPESKSRIKIRDSRFLAIEKNKNPSPKSECCRCLRCSSVAPRSPRRQSVVPRHHRRKSQFGAASWGICGEEKAKRLFNALKVHCPLLLRVVYSLLHRIDSRPMLLHASLTFTHRVPGSKG